MAIEYIQHNDNVLPKYELKLYDQDGKCQAHHVMKSFINYFNSEHEKIMGILGPGQIY